MATKYVYYFGDGDAEGDESMRLILGGKGANLAQMAKKPLSLPVPSGFTISIDVCQEYYKLGRKYPDALAAEVAANLAKLYAGLCYANLGKWQEAADLLDSYSAGDDAMVSPAAEAALGNAYANLNKIDDAISCLKKAAKMADSKVESGRNLSIAPQFLLQAAQLLESQGKTADALEIYQNIKKDYVGSAVSRDIDKYIERASK